jgi:hypothetical protein
MKKRGIVMQARYLLLIFLCTYLNLWASEMILSLPPEVTFSQPDEVNLQVGLKSIDLEQLDEREKKFLCNLSGDYEVLSTLVGTVGATVLKTAHFVNSDFLFGLVLAEQKKRFEKMPQDQKYLYNWLIQDVEKQKFIGHLSLAMYLGPRPEKYKNRVLMEPGLVLHGAYRHQKLVYLLAKLILPWLRQYPPFDQTIFCLSTPKTHVQMHTFAKKLGLICSLSHEEEVDLGFYTTKILCDLFILEEQIS